MAKAIIEAAKNTAGVLQKQPAMDIKVSVLGERILALQGAINRMLLEITRTATSRELLKRHVRTPLYSNAYYLMASTFVISVLGFAFWAVAARLYSPENVGLGSAIFSASGLLATLSGLGLGYGLIRFLSNAGEKSTKMINSCLTIAGLCSLTVSVIFLVGLDLWSPALAFIRDQLSYIISFLLFTLLLTFSLLLNEIFVAKRKAKFTFIKNIVANSLKIPLVIVVITWGAFGIYASAGLGVTIGVAMSMLWLLPMVQRGYSFLPTIQREAANDLVHYSLNNYVANFLWTRGAPTFLLPLMVVSILGAEANAYFYIAWNIALIVFMVPGAISWSLFAEGSHSEELLLPNTRSALKLSFLILVPATVLIFVLGNKVLLLFGQAYSDNATSLLWILALSAFPMSVNELYLAVNRVRKNMKRLIMISALAGGLSLGLSYFLMIEMGLVGVGVGWLAGQSLVAVFVLSLVVRSRHSKSSIPEREV